MTSVKFERIGKGWRLYVSDFAATDHTKEFTDVRVHFDKDAALVVERFNAGTDTEFFTVGTGLAHVFFGPEQARAMRYVLDQLFSVDAVSGGTASTEPTWNSFPTQEFE